MGKSVCQGKLEGSINKGKMGNKSTGRGYAQIAHIDMEYSVTFDE